MVLVQDVWMWMWMLIQQGYSRKAHEDRDEAMHGHAWGFVKLLDVTHGYFMYYFLTRACFFLFLSFP